MKEDIIIYLPWPPTINDYYRVTKAGQRYLDKKVRAYRAGVAESISEQCPGLYIEDTMFLEVCLYPPDRRKRDLDNYMKGLLDALTEAALWEDDVLINQLHIYRGEVVKGGSVKISISDSGPVLKRDSDMI